MVFLLRKLCNYPDSFIIHLPFLIYLLLSLLIDLSDILCRIFFRLMLLIPPPGYKHIINHHKIKTQ